MQVFAFLIYAGCSGPDGKLNVTRLSCAHVGAESLLLVFLVGAMLPAHGVRIRKRQTGHTCIGSKC